MESFLKNEIEAAVANLKLMSKRLESDARLLEEANRMIGFSLDAGGKLLIAGNGGSAADAQHLAAEIVGRFRKERKGMPAVALTTDTSVLTAVGNDYGFEAVFARQVEALGKKGDVFLGITTSGNSANIISALKSASASGMRTITLTGGDGGAAAKASDLALIFPSVETPRIQEYHAVVIHIMASLLEERGIAR